MCSKFRFLQLAMFTLTVLVTGSISLGQDNEDPVQELVNRLDLESYKTAIRGPGSYTPLTLPTICSV